MTTATPRKTPSKKKIHISETAHAVRKSVYKPAQTKYVMPTINYKPKRDKCAFVAYVLQNTQVISRGCLRKKAKKCTNYNACAQLLCFFVWWRSRCRCRRDLLSCIFCGGGNMLLEQCTWSLKIEVILSLLHSARIHSSWILFNMLRGQNFVGAQDTGKKWDVTRRDRFCKIFLLHGLSTCPVESVDLNSKLCGCFKIEKICLHVKMSGTLANVCGERG